MSRPARAERWLALAGALALAAGTARWLLPASGPDPALPAPVHAGARLVADAGGPIRLAVTSLNSARGSALRNAPLVSRIVNALAPQTDVLMLVSDRAAFSVASETRPGRARFVEMPAGRAITIWPQDPFLVLTSATSGPRLLVSRVFERAGDRHMAAALGAALGWPIVDSGLSFDGGNIVSDGEHAFVGADTVARNARELGLAEAEIARRFERELGRRVIVVGPAPQPIGHIDMMLTPLGGGRLALADPGAGARLAEQELSSAPGSVAAFEAAVERDFFGHPAIGALRTPAGEVIAAPEVRGRTRDAIDDSRLLTPVLDRVAEALAARGFNVERVPLLLAYRAGAGADAAARERPLARLLPYPMITYNNVVLERVAGVDRVYLPHYGWPAMDAAAAGRWRALGYEVHPVGGFATSAMYGGALRCALKVLERG